MFLSESTIAPWRVSSGLGLPTGGCFAPVTGLFSRRSFFFSGVRFSADPTGLVAPDGHDSESIPNDGSELGATGGRFVGAGGGGGARFFIG
jgi:hypothetical protein